MQVIQIDVALTATIVGLIATAIGAFGWLLKMDRNYHDLPARVQKLEDELGNCPAKSLDAQALEEQLNELTKKSDNDFRMIMQMSKSQAIMMKGLCAILDHMETGNHTKEMAAVKTEMMEEMMKSREEVLRYE